MSTSDLITSNEPRDIPGFPGYMVSPDSSVYSCWTGGGKHSWITDTIQRKLKPGRLGKPGKQYHKVSLYIDGKATGCTVHSLVLLTFIGPRPDGCEACHINGNRFDNRLDNLRWDTHVANESDKVLHGTLPYGEQIHCSKLTSSQVLEIRQLRSRGLQYAEIAERFCLSDSTVGNIVRRETWKHI